MKKLLIIMLVLALVVPVFAGDKPKVKPEEYPYAQAAVDYYVLNSTTGIIKQTGGIYTTYDTFLDAFSFFERKGIKHIKVYINSAGGGLFVGLAVGEMMKEYEAKGWLIETYCHGLAASAASIIMIAGSPGHRYMAPHAFLMIHELSVVKFLSVESVSDTEKEAQTLRAIQKDVNSFVASCGKNQTAESIKKLAKEESWLLASKARELGFIDHILGED